MTTWHKIIVGDARDMKEIASDSVHLIITSPPYWQLKDYGTIDQIGFNDTYEGYINNLNLVWNECIRVLHSGCRLCINIGDQFARSVYYGRYKVIPIRTEIIKFCESAGLDYMGAIIWQKVTTVNTSGGAVIMGSYPYPRNGILKLDYEFILLFKKPGKSPIVADDLKARSRLTKDEWNQFFYGHWNFPGEKQKKHLAMFPKELPYRLIKMFSFVGDTVMDPFLGSGTTSLAAMKLTRNSVGYEINEEFLPLIKDRLKIRQQTVFDEAKFEITRQKNVKTDFQGEINKLPYVFKDPVPINKKVDPKKVTFGSKIDNASQERQTYYTVKQIISPVLLLLNDDTKVNLLGVKELPEKTNQAIQFLQEKTRGQKIFIKQDSSHKDADNNWSGYVYLKNKTFLNAHLVKNGLVGVATEIEFKYREKFLAYRRKANELNRVELREVN